MNIYNLFIIMLCTFFRFSLQYKIISAKLDNIRVKLYNKVYITLQ